MKKQYVYTLPAADYANIEEVIEDISSMIDDEQIFSMGKCVIDALVKCRLHKDGAIPGGTLAFCEETLEACTLIESKQIVFNVVTQQKGDER